MKVSPICVLHNMYSSLKESYFGLEYPSGKSKNEG